MYSNMSNSVATQLAREARGIDREMVQELEAATAGFIC